MDNAKILIGVLKAVQFKDLATIFATANGLKVTVEGAKCIQGNAFLHADLFREYRVTLDIISFRTNLNVLIDCLSIFGASNQNSSTSLILNYKNYGSTLDLLLEESGVVAECNVRTMDAFEILDFDFTNDTTTDKVIIKSDCMREAFSELDMTSEILELALLPPSAPQPRLRLTTYGVSGTMHFDLPRTSDQVEVFDVRSLTPRVARYRLSILRPAIGRAVNMACRISLRINERGFLSLQHMINLTDGKAAFVEFFCVPDEDDEDEVDDQVERIPTDLDAGGHSKVNQTPIRETIRPRNVYDPDWSD